MFQPLVSDQNQVLVSFAEASTVLMVVHVAVPGFDPALAGSHSMLRPSRPIVPRA